MKQLYAPNGKKIVATADTIQAIAYVSGFDDDGSPIYSGSSDVDWNSQSPVKIALEDDDDTIMVVDEKGQHWKQSECEVREKDDQADRAGLNVE